MSELLADDHSNNPLGGEGGYSHTSTTSTLRPLATKQHSSALSTRRHSATSYNAGGNISSRQPIRPTPQPPRSPLIPPRPSSRPSSPPSRPTARYPSPPMRAQSVMTGVGRLNAAGPHAQQTLAELNGPKPEELVKFADLCRQLYYDQDAGAAQSVDAILNRLPAGSRTQYARTMAAMRSQFHRDEEIRRREQVEAALVANEPGRRIMDALGVREGGKIAMRSSRAKQERAKLVKTFIQNHCVKAMPGTHPFFRSLYAMLFLQALGAGKGGAGKRRVEWEIDMAVFSEASGGTWLADSIELLKGVLGCSEQIKESPRDSYFDEEDENNLEAHTPPQMPTIARPTPEFGAGESVVRQSQSKRTPPKVPPHRPSAGASLRERSSSDPFLDPGDRRTPVANGPLSDPPPPGLPSSSSSSSTPFLDSSSTSPSTSSPPPARPSPVPRHSSHTPTTPAPPPPPQFRIFTLPSYLTDPELQSLTRLFPDFITSRAKASAQFGAGGSKGAEDEEGGVGVTARLGLAEEGSAGGVGHGEVRIGGASRDEGFRGTGWERFVCWLRGLFGL